MGRPAKFVKFTGKRKRMAVRCPKCGCDKTIELRKTQSGVKVSGASELTKQPPAP